MSHKLLIDLIGAVKLVYWPYTWAKRKGGLLILNILEYYTRLGYLGIVQNLALTDAIKFVEKAKKELPKVQKFRI